MNQSIIDQLINSLKRIVESNNTIDIPSSSEKGIIELKSKNHLFIVDMNRNGHKKPKCTFQLRNQENKDQPLLRLDLIGRNHTNPPGDYHLAGQTIPCPHIHIAHPDYGDNIAYPLNDTYAKMYLTDEEINDLMIVLQEFLKRCNVGNIDSYNFQLQDNLL